MKKKEYSLEIPKLELGHHEFSFFLDSDFFEAHSEIKASEVNAKLSVERTPQMILIDFHLNGSITLECDRCLLPYSQIINHTQRMIYSFEKSLKDSEDSDVAYLSRGAYLLDLTQDLYDFVALQVPFRKVPDDCPRPECPEDYFDKAGQTEDNPSQAENTVWDVLKQMKFKDNQIN